MLIEVNQMRSASQSTSTKNLNGKTTMYVQPTLNLKIIPIKHDYYFTICLLYLKLLCYCTIVCSTYCSALCMCIERRPS